MKKLFLSILVISSLLGGNAYAETLYYDCKQTSNSQSHEYVRYILNPESNKLNVSYKWNDEYYNKYIGKRIVAGTPKVSSTDRNIISDNGKTMNVSHEGKTFKFNYGSDGKVLMGNRHILNCFKTSELFTASTGSNTADLTFTIKDKKEQCTAIGFAPATEKFADCVLRLVELDVKSQQAAQIALAQSQGNQQVAEQLKKQNNSRSSDAFINFGLKLLSPQSTVSAPSTSTCRVIGSGAYKTVNCW